MMTTTKKKLLALLALTLVAAACGTTDEEGAAPNAPPAATTPPAEQPAPKRTLLENVPAMGTRPDNLVLDPTFATVGAMYGNAIYTSEDTSLRVEAPATSPAGIAQPVLVVKGTGLQPIVLLAVQGGTGPLDVSVFVSVPDGKKAPAVTLSTIDGMKSFALEATTKTEQHGDRTYKMHHARIEEAVLGKVYLFVEPGLDAVTLSKPEVVAADMKKPGAKAQLVALGPSAQRAIHAFATRPVTPDPPAAETLRFGRERVRALSTPR